MPNFIANFHLQSLWLYEHWIFFLHPQSRQLADGEEIFFQNIIADCTFNVNKRLPYKGKGPVWIVTIHLFNYGEMVELSWPRKSKENFLTGRPQVVQVGNITSSTLILNTGVPQRCVLSPLLYSLFSHDCVATHSSNTIVKFADDTTAIGLITDGDETLYREEVRPFIYLNVNHHNKQY